MAIVALIIHSIVKRRNMSEREVGNIKFTIVCGIMAAILLTLIILSQ